MWDGKTTSISGRMRNVANVIVRLCIVFDSYHECHSRMRKVEKVIVKLSCI